MAPSRWRSVAWSGAVLVASIAGAGTGTRVPFEDATRLAGLDFAYQTGADGALHLPEIMGGGAALFDFDNDGELDLYLVQGGRFGPGGAPRGGTDHDRLWLNRPAVEAGGRRRVRFVDVSADVGLTAAGYGMGVTTGDYDNDGWTDVFVTGYGSARLLRNREGRRLEDVTAAAGVAEAGWSVSATFVDFDGDGGLDLFVPRYVDYAPVRCRLPSSRPDYCGPRSFTPEPDRLFRNRGDGTFEDVTARRLEPHRPGAGLGVVAADLDDDGLVDLYVANDGSDNHLWLNQGGRAFREDGLMAGVGLSRTGQALAGMGVDAGDVDGDLRLDLFVTNLTGETNSLYLNQGGGVFEDATLGSGLGPASLALTGFGTRLLDYDNDGWLDVVVVDGAVHLTDPVPGAAVSSPLAQPKLLFRNLGHGRFADRTREAGEPFTRPEVSRGLAAGDVDGDGDVDLVVVNEMGPARLLMNRVGQDAPWIGLRLVTRDGRRDALGARAVLRRHGAPDLLRHAHADGSYASAADPRVLFGLGSGADVTGLEVRWPDGAREEFDAPALRRYTLVREGTGRTSPAGSRR